MPAELLAVRRVVLINHRRYLLLFLRWQFHDEVVQFLGQTLLVVVGLLSWHIDCLQGGATFESILANLLNTNGLNLLKDC
jgi:nicotinamide riboside transporter PnuC